MNTALRTSTLTLSAIILVAASGCSSDTTAADDPDAVALDSSLEQEILAAKGDSSPFIMADAEVPAPAVVIKTQPPRPQPVRAIAVRPAAPRKAPSFTDTRPIDEPAQVLRAWNRTPPKLTVPSGSRFVLQSTRRICVNTSKVGDRFTARVTEPVRGVNGIVIPRGARMNGVIQSLTGSLGEENLDIDIRSVTVAGSTYAVPSRVTKIQLDRTPGAERCIPDNGAITAELTSPLRVSSRE